MAKSYEVRLQTGRALGDITARERRMLNRLAEQGAANAQQIVAVKTGKLRSRITAVSVGGIAGPNASGIHADTEYALTQERRAAYLEPGAFAAGDNLEAIANEERF